jgi:hypothetical protein
MYLNWKVVGLVVVLGACGPVIGAPADESTSTDAPPPASSQGDEQSSVAEEVTTDEPMPPPPMTTSVGDTSTTTTDPDATSIGFLPEPDFDDDVFECSMWEQDCPRGEKCMPWANDGGSSWNATRCSPLDPNPRDVGEECMVEGSGVSGIDNCEIGAMCWDVDPDTNMGECVAFCENEANPSCADECSQCHISGEGVLTLCLEGCDPIAQNCDEGDGCYATYDTFACVVDASEGEGAIGTTCDFINACDPGTACMGPEFVPGCAGNGCCAPFCSLEVADPCESLLPGTVCMPWWEEGQAPGGCVDQTVIGVCVAP